MVAQLESQYLTMCVHTTYVCTKFLGMFYWMLLNIHPAHHSSLHSIQLLAVAKSTDIRVYGIDAVLTPVIADLECLAKEVCT